MASLKDLKFSYLRSLVRIWRERTALWCTAFLDIDKFGAFSTERLHSLVRFYAACISRICVHCLWAPCQRNKASSRIVFGRYHPRI